LAYILYVGEDIQEINRAFEEHDFRHLYWQEAGVYGDDASDLVKTRCSQINDMKDVDCLICETLSSAPVIYQLRIMGYSGPTLLIPRTNPYPLRNFIHTLLISQVWGPTDVVISGSKSAGILYDYFFNMKSLPVHAYGIDTVHFSPKDKRIARRKFSLPDGKILLYTGRGSPDKNIASILLIYNSLKKLIPNLDLVMSFLFKDDLYLNKLDLEGTIILNKIQYDDMPYVYSAADLFVSCATSYFETFGRSPLESISCGTPVVVPRWNGFQDYIKKGNGHLVEVDYLERALYESQSYAMVNLPKFLNQCIDSLNSSNQITCLDKKASYEYCKHEISKLISMVIKKNNTNSIDISDNWKSDEAAVRRIISALKLSSLDQLFYFSTCSNSDLPQLDYELERDLYYSLFKDISPRL
jgi:glycosyltransferase involved in cell wall biosynthesis